MLSRVADNLYWMSRYIERAEGMARMIQVHQSQALEYAQDDQQIEEFWKPVLLSICAEDVRPEEGYRKIGKSLIFSTVFKFYLFLHCSCQGKCPNGTRSIIRRALD